MNYNYATTIAFFSITPVIIFVSWLIQIVIDDPYKDFAYELDIVSRYKKPAVRNAAGGGEVNSQKSEDDKVTSYLRNSWKFFALVIYMLMVYITTEAYSYYAVRESVHDEYDNEPKQFKYKAPEPYEVWTT